MTEEEKIQLVNDCFNNKMPAELKILYLWCELDWKQISKNRQHQIVGNRLINTNTPFMKKLIEEISIETKIQNIQWEQTKTWILINVTKQTKKGDPINVIDVLADCIKQGIGIDDVEYSLIINSCIDPTIKIPKIDYWILQGHPIQVELLISKFLQQGKI